MPEAVSNMVSGILQTTLSGAFQEDSFAKDGLVRKIPAFKKTMFALNPQSALDYNYHIMRSLSDMINKISPGCEIRHT